MLSLRAPTLLAVWIALVLLGSARRLWSADVVLHEIVAQNETGLRDADGDRSDWIEIRNLESVEVDLSGWYLTDDPSDLARWRIPELPATRLAPGDYLLVFASGKDRAGTELHASFRLAAEGEYCALVEPDGVTVAHELAPRFPPQRADISYGFPRGVEDLPPPAREPKYLRPATPSAENAASTVEFVADTSFSVDRGFFDGPFEVEISTATPDATIRFTRDGSAPTASHGEIYTGPISISGTTILRAAAFRDGFEPTNIDTQTYLFLDDVIQQPSRPDGFPATWAGQAADYAMDPEICTDVSSEHYEPTIREDLRSVPTISIVAERDDFFGSTRGIYTHPLDRGSAWERRCSIEYFGDAGGREFQVDCGVRIHGNSSARPIEGKHSFRLEFRGRYGASVLREKFFPDSDVDEFDSIVLRCFSTDSWHFKDGGSRYRRWDSQYIRDPFLRRSQLAMGSPSAHTKYVHVYVNGLYWGLYDASERPDDEFQVSYQGGRDDDWDVVKDFAENFRGDLRSWNDLMNAARAGFATQAAYEAVQGHRPDGSPDPSRPALLDVDNLIDWMILHLWACAEDWPHHNWYAARDRTGNSGGWRFFVWDQEIILDSAFRNRVDVANDNSPAFVYARLRQNPEFRLRFADHVRRHLGPGGALSVEGARERWNEFANTIDRAIVGESARWGDFREDVPDPSRSPAELYTRTEHWLPEKARVLGEYIPRSHELALERFRAEDLYPDFDPPTAVPRGGLVERGALLRFDAAGGLRVFYTLDGSDPRLPGGALAPSAREYGAGDRILLVGERAPAKALVPSDGSFGLAWVDPDFDDASWLEGTTGVGFERTTGYEDVIGLDVAAEMDGVNATALVRVPFTVDATEGMDRLLLNVRYDDGFVAFINGTEVARRNAPDDLTWDASATAPRPDADAIVPEPIDITEHVGLLELGTNLLAVQGLNSSASSGDFLIYPELEAVGGASGPPAIERTTRVRARALRDDTWSALEDVLFVVDSSLLRVTEVMFHPPADLDGVRNPDDYEFIELANVGTYPLSLSGVRFSGGVRFTFPDEANPARDLPPGGIVLVVRDIEAFTARYGASGFEIAGEYEGRLANDGDRITISDAAGNVILDFTYDDGWYPEADGDGSSLEPIDPLQSPGAWSDAAAWRPSDVPTGTPGEFRGVEVSGLRRIGDINSDANLDVSDAIALLTHLFAGGGNASLPCGGDDILEGGNRVISDVNGDNGVDLTDAIVLLRYLFLAGPPPAGGAECQVIAGCAPACH